MISDNVEFLRYSGGHFENGDGRNCSMSGINSGHHNLPTYEMTLKSEMLNLCGIVVPILKMATGRNFAMSGINPGHHYLTNVLRYHTCRSSHPEGLQK